MHNLGTRRFSTLYRTTQVDVHLAPMAAPPHALGRYKKGGRLRLPRDCRPAGEYIYGRRFRVVWTCRHSWLGAAGFPVWGRVPGVSALPSGLAAADHR
jgi:hypothetical protein